MIGEDSPRIATIGAIALHGASSASLLVQFDLAGFAVSAGSACGSGKMKQSAVLAARPKLLATATLVGKRLDDPEVRRIVGEICEKQGKPLENVPYEAPYRRKVLPVHARRALTDILRGG